MSQYKNKQNQKSEAKNKSNIFNIATITVSILIVLVIGFVVVNNNKKDTDLSAQTDNTVLVTAKSTHLL